MTAAETLQILEALGDEKRRKHNTKHGAGKNQFGVPMGEIRKVAKQIKTNHKLALALWKTKNIDARLLAILWMKPKALSAKALDKLVRSETFSQVADWLNAYIVKKHPDKEALRVQWMEDDHPMTLRAGWNLTAQRVEKDSDGLDISTILDRIEAEMADAEEAAQWMMNFTLVGIGIHHAKLRKRALKFGESLGIYRDYPCPKRCTSPFAPIWINEMVKRQERPGRSVRDHPHRRHA